MFCTEDLEKIDRHFILPMNERPEPWPPPRPPKKHYDAAIAIVTERMREYFKQMGESKAKYRVAARRMKPKNVAMYVTYEPQKKSLEVIVVCSMEFRHAISEKILPLDLPLPEKETRDLLNGLDPLDSPIVAASLVHDFLNSFGDSDDMMVSEAAAALSLPEEQLMNSQRETKESRASLPLLYQDILAGVYGSRPYPSVPTPNE